MLRLLLLRETAMQGVAWGIKLREGAIGVMIPLGQATIGYDQTVGFLPLPLLLLLL